MEELVLRFHGPRVETEDEVVEIEDALVELLEQGETCDGRDFDASPHSIRIVTPHARATFARIAPFLARAGLIEHVVAVARPSAGEPSTTLWPQDSAEATSRP